MLCSKCLFHSVNQSQKGTFANPLKASTRAPLLKPHLSLHPFWWPTIRYNKIPIDMISKRNICIYIYTHINIHTHTNAHFVKSNVYYIVYHINMKIHTIHLPPRRTFPVSLPWALPHNVAILLVWCNSSRPRGFLTVGFLAAPKNVVITMGNYRKPSFFWGYIFITYQSIGDFFEHLFMGCFWSKG